MTLDELAMELRGERRFDIVASLKELERSGVGTFVVGRKGGKSRFVWNERSPSGEKAGGMPVAARPSTMADAAATDRAVPSPQATSEPERPVAASAETLRHSFHLRPGVVTILNLPADITLAEVERLCGFLRAIPFS